MTRENYQRVGVHKDALAELRQAPAVKFGEGYAEVRSRQQLQVVSVIAVEDVHDRHHVKQLFQLMPTITITSRAWLHHKQPLHLKMFRKF